MNLPFEIPEELKPGMVVLIGLPWDENSSHRKGAALAPLKIREALHSGSSNLCCENGVDLGTHVLFRDIGDLELNGQKAPLDRIEEAFRVLLDKGTHVLCLGGDHALTYPVVKAHAERYGPLEILHLDAHPDLYEDYQGNRLSHACPFARIMEQGLASRLLQVGIRGMNPHQRTQAERFGVEVLEMKDWKPDYVPPLKGPLYLSLDLDVLDPGFAPGVSHPEPGGLSTREVIRLIQGLESPILGADIVEYNPTRDPTGITAMVAAKFLREIAGHMIGP